jgi:hypothetical protein
MRTLQTARVINHSTIATVNDGTNAVTTAIDTAGYSGGDLLIIAGYGSIAGSTTFSAMKVQESDDNSSFSDVSGCVVGTSTLSDGSATSVVFAGADDDNSQLIFHIPLTESRKRYFKFVSTNSAHAVVMNCVAVLVPGGLSDGSEDTTAATTGAHQQFLRAT